MHDDHGIMVKPSGPMLSVRSRPGGSLMDGIPALERVRCIISKPRQHNKPWLPVASIRAPQEHTCTSTTQARAFSVVGPFVWNGLPLSQRLLPGFFLTHFTLASKLYSLAVQGSGALLSSNLEEALHKSP